MRSSEPPTRNHQEISLDLLRYRVFPAYPATAVGTLVSDGPGKGRQSLGETTPEPRQGLERLLALLLSRVLVPPYSSRLHSPLGLGRSRFLWLPEIHTGARYFKALVRIEHPV